MNRGKQWTRKEIEAQVESRVKNLMEAGNRSEVRK